MDNKNPENYFDEIRKETEEKSRTQDFICEIITFRPHFLETFLSKISETEKEQITYALQDFLLMDSEEITEFHEKYFQHLPSDLTQEERRECDLITNIIKEKGVIYLSLEHLIFIFGNKTVIQKSLIASKQRLLDPEYKNRCPKTITDETENEILRIFGTFSSTRN